MARMAAEQAQDAAVEAANAEVAQKVMKRGPRVMPHEEFDRTLEFIWNKTMLKTVLGKREWGHESPISQLSEEEFQKEFLAALQTFVDMWPEEGMKWELPEIENWIVYEPAPLSQKRSGATWDPHA